MSRPRKWENDTQRRQAQTDRRKAERQRHEVDFIAVDGEGIGRSKDHKYVLLGVGDVQIENPDGLGFVEIVKHLNDMRIENPKSAFVGFFLGYDFTQWFKTLPLERAKMLLTEQGKARRQRTKYPQLGPFPVEYEGWEFDILGMKRFKVRETGISGWTYVCDAGSFFQESLMSVIDPKGWSEPVVTQDEYRILGEGKSKRDSAGLDRDMRYYNVLENAVLARLMARLNTGLSQAGIHLRKNQWFGPGQAAQAWLTQVKAPTGESIRASITANGQIQDYRSGRHGNVQKAVSRQLKSPGHRDACDRSAGACRFRWSHGGVRLHAGRRDRQ